MSAPTRIAATFTGGSLDGKWSYLPQGAATYSLGQLKLDGTSEVYELVDTIWHSVEDSVLSHQVYALVGKQQQAAKPARSKR